MDITTPATANIKTPESETEAPTRIQISKSLSFSNGVLKRHSLLHHHNPLVLVIYKECLKNHAASLGGHAVDGCGEFMSSPTATSADPTSLKCAACGCHRNFHRRDPEEPLPTPNTIPAIEYQPHHRHHPPPPRGGCHDSSPNSTSPPPISSSYYPSAPHMLLALSTGLSAPQPDNNPSMAITVPVMASANGRKRFRTKFTQDQKERMLEYAEKVGWKMQKRDEELVTEFCNEVGLDKGVLKVWMHNNKNTYGKRDSIATASTTHYPNDNENNNNNNNTHQDLNHQLHNNDSVSGAHVVATNGSSSSC